jgi:flagellar L-ring protein precursor FlgH
MTATERLQVLLIATTPLLFAAAPAPTGPSAPGQKPTAARTAPPTNNNNSAPDPAQNASQIMQRNGGSLLRATLSAQVDPSQAELNAVSYFAVPAPQPKVLQKHDLVTIIVREESDYSSTGTTDLKKNYDLDFRIEQFIRANLENFSFVDTNTGHATEIKLNGIKNFKGDATVDRVDALTTRITAEVVDVKPNGTIVLQARAHTRFDEEDMLMILSGTCRAEDVSADNTILSSQLHDKDLVKKHTGAVRDTTKRGWIPRFFDWFQLF